MTPELLSSTAAIFLSLLFSYIPGFSSWYDPLSPTLKRLVMLALLLLGKLEDRLVRHHNSERTVEVMFGAREVELPHVQEMLTAARLEVLSVSVSSNHGMHTAAFQTRGAQERYPRVLHELLAEHGVHRVSLL